MNDNIVDKTLDAITTMMAEEAKSAEDAIFNGLIGGMDADLVRLPEGVFVKYFLPMFSSREDYTGTPRYQQWLEVAGGPYNEVVIVAQDQTELFRVPAAQSTAIINTMGVGNDISIKRIVDQRIAEGNNNSIAAERIMIDRLSNVAIFNKEAYIKANEEFIRKWNIIFAYYKLPLIDFKVVSSQTQSEDDDDILVYD